MDWNDLGILRSAWSLHHQGRNPAVSHFNPPFPFLLLSPARRAESYAAWITRSPSATRPSSHRAPTTIISTSSIRSTLYAAAVPKESERSCARISTEMGRLL